MAVFEPVQLLEEIFDIKFSIKETLKTKTTKYPKNKVVHI